MTLEWPKLDPITQRMICENCWNHVHRTRDTFGRTRHACIGECDCVHRSEETWAAIEQAKVKSNRRELRKNLQEHLESSPLAAQNDSFKSKGKGKTHA